MINLPDPQHLELDALYDAIHTAHDDGLIDEDDIQYLFENEPESVTFTADYLDEAYADDYEAARECVIGVGERDLDAKIRYWRREINQINSNHRSVE